MSSQTNTTISAGNMHSLILDSNGQVWSTGSNELGQLGLGDQDNRNRFTAIPGLPQIISISAGDNLSLLLDQNGRVWSFGSNDFGALGLGLSDDGEIIDQPTLIEGIPRMVAISAGGYHSLLLDEAGHVWVYGKNNAKELGVGNQDRHDRPIRIEGLPRIIQVSAGDGYSLMLDQQGGVWACGFNGHGQLGLGDRLKRERPTQIMGLPPMAKVDAGYSHSLFLDEQGHVWSCGFNQYGQLALPEESTVPVRIDGFPEILINISTGSNHSLFLDAEGHVWSVGRNNLGQLGYSNYGLENEPNPIENLPKIIAISTTGVHNLILDETGQVWVFGSNEEGRLGIDTNSRTNSRTIPTMVTDIHAMIPHPLSSDQPISTVPAAPAIITPIRTSYPIVAHLLTQGQIVDYRIRSRLGLSDVEMEFEDNHGQVYLARVNYDAATDQIHPPHQPEPLFDILEGLIQTGQLIDYQFRDDLPTDAPNQVLEFKNERDQTYLILVHQGEDGQIYPPVL